MNLLIIDAVFQRHLYVCGDSYSTFSPLLVEAVCSYGSWRRKAFGRTVITGHSAILASKKSIPLFFQERQNLFCFQSVFSPNCGGATLADTKNGKD